MASDGFTFHRRTLSQTLHNLRVEIPDQVAGNLDVWRRNGRTFPVRRPGCPGLEGFLHCRGPLCVRLAIPGAPVPQAADMGSVLDGAVLGPLPFAPLPVERAGHFTFYRQIVMHNALRGVRDASYIVPDQVAENPRRYTQKTFTALHLDTGVRCRRVLRHLDIGTGTMVESLGAHLARQG